MKMTAGEWVVILPNIANQRDAGAILEASGNVTTSDAEVRVDLEDEYTARCAYWDEFGEYASDGEDE